MFVEEEGHSKLLFHGRINKNRQGGVATRNIAAKIGELFSKPEDKRCPLKLFCAYLDRIPNDGAFYKRPCKDKFSKQNIGPKVLALYMPRMYKAANINLNGSLIVMRYVTIYLYFI